ncbi:uncharacterized protein LOC104900931 [Beta vulgaris subsp. vulgaris]|uniref:uncharacterized protein LOC104900931 n=1 Tax=Beta vulgaris subsp. vulgaris TaxID=3555 RepID=UPI0020369C1D|nr:uncharacterized protein LOC104900931 [Beta vulgaris subsp. vulgaris]
MSTAVTSSPANQDRPLLLHSSRQSSDQRRIRTLLDLLTIEKMDGVDRTMRRNEEQNNNDNSNNNNISRWKILRERLGLNSIGCCGVATWRFDNNNSSSQPEDENAVVLQLPEEETGLRQQEDEVGPAEGMNLADALAAERQFRAAESSGSYGVDEGGTTPFRVSLMRLLEETADGCDLERERSKGRGGGEGEEVLGLGNDSVCCVCMGRKKGAAFIPCGHTYCRVCSRELWVNRGSCPLCNRQIIEILDIF